MQADINAAACGDTILVAAGSTLGTLTLPAKRCDNAHWITIKSTGTNGWSATPEFKCDASAPTWSPVATFTNTFNAGTNTTTFPRLDPICGSTNVLIRIRNQAN